MTSHAGVSGSPAFLIVSPARRDEYIALTGIWERAVRATHAFLTEEAILEIRHDIYDIYLRSMDVFVARLVFGADRGGETYPDSPYQQAASRRLVERVKKHVTGQIMERVTGQVIERAMERAMGEVTEWRIEGNTDATTERTKTRSGEGCFTVACAQSDTCNRLSARDVSEPFPQNHAFACVPECSIPLGFLGMSGKHIAMLFIDPPYHRLGLGKFLVSFALDRGATSVDVNEQNPGAYAFYKSLGFRKKGRSSHDAQGNPFPILHLDISP